MSNVIKPYTPLYRAEILGDCACGEPIWVVPVDLFGFSMPKPPSENTSYQLVTFINDVPYTLKLSIFNSIDSNHNYCILVYDFDDGCMVLERQAFSGSSPLTVNICPGQCVELQLRTMTVLFPDIIFGDVLATYTFRVADVCDNIVKIEYYLPCEEFAYHYNMQGTIRRQPDVLADEVNYVQPNGNNKRVFSRYQNVFLLKSFPFGLAEHDFISRIFDSTVLIDSDVYDLNEAALWTLNNPNNPYTTGQIELVRDARIVSSCCHVIEES